MWYYEQPTSATPSSAHQALSSLQDKTATMAVPNRQSMQVVAASQGMAPVVQVVAEDGVASAAAPQEGSAALNTPVAQSSAQTSALADASAADNDMAQVN